MDERREEREELAEIEREQDDEAREQEAARDYWGESARPADEDRAGGRNTLTRQAPGDLCQ